MILANLRAQAWKYATYALGVLAVALLIVGLLFWVRGTSAAARADAAEQRAEASEARVKALNEVIETERAAAKRANAIAAQYEQDKIHAEADAKRTVADLRAGNLRLLAHWQGCKAGLPQANGTASEPDASADDRAESAGRIVRAAKDADSQIRALQDFIKSERGVEK